MERSGVDRSIWGNNHSLSVKPDDQQHQNQWGAPNDFHHFFWREIAAYFFEVIL